jgi:hypothetical protein
VQGGAEIEEKKDEKSVQMRVYMSTKNVSVASETDEAGDYIITKYSLPKALTVSGNRSRIKQNRAIS